MNEQQRAARIGAVAELQEISLRSVDARLPSFDGSGPVDLDLSWEAKPEQSGSGNTLTYVFHLALATTAGEDLHIDCAFEVVYTVPEEAGFDDEDLYAFGDVSVTFSAFPYARELVQNLTTRASLPPLVLGALRSPLDRDATGEDVSEQL